MKKIFTIITLIFCSLITAKAQTDSSKVGADTIASVVEHQADFPGGMEKFYNYLAMNIHYPKQARDNNEHGRVLVQMIVEKDGSLSNVRVIRKLSPSLDAEAIRLVKDSPKWIPASNKRANGL